MTRTPPARTLWFRCASAEAEPVHGQPNRLESLILDGLLSVPAAGPPERLPGDRSAARASDTDTDAPGAARSGELALIRAVHPPAGDSAGVAAVLLVSGMSGADVLTVNGVGVGEGLHVLRHGDCVVHGALSLWVSVDRVAEEGTYDPDTDGRDVFCARTKLRLEPGDLIIRCPGTPTRGCDLVFRASTWDASLRCHQCGHDPAAPRWSPPDPGRHGAHTSRIETLLRHAFDA